MKKINKVDLIALAIVALFIGLSVVIVKQPERDLGVPATLTVRVENSVETIYPEVSKKGTAYLNGVNEPAVITEVARDGETLLITLEAMGTKEDERLTFNGQRVLIGQKAEIHGSFWAQGTITGFELR